MTARQALPVAIPEDFLSILGARQDASDNEQQVGKAVKVLDGFRSNILGPGQRKNAAFRSARDGARKMARSGGRSPAWQDKLLESWQVFVELVEVAFQAIDKRLGYGAMARYAELAPKFEQIVLRICQAAAHVVRHRVVDQYHANGAVGFVDRAIGFHPRAVLRSTAAVAEAGRTIVTGACVDLAESISHGATIGSSSNTVKIGACVRAQ